MQTTAAAITMVRDDHFFLKTWLAYYGNAFGRENCYIINHGRGGHVEEMAEGCNIIGIPGDPHPKFDVKRWRLLNGLQSGLLSYYKQVIVGDVDEIVLVDPQDGRSLLEFLTDSPKGRVLTPLGLEVIHRTDIEDEQITDHILGPRRHVRLAPHYSKPCVVSTQTKIARGGHYSRHPELISPPDLYLMHLKFCDFDNYVGVMDQRNDMTVATKSNLNEASIGRHWFASARGEDRKVFDDFADIPTSKKFKLGWVRNDMAASWRPRGETGFWQFDFPPYNKQYELPERFNGVF